MRQYIAFSLVAIVLSTTHALADCQTSLAAALEATRAAEPMQSKMQHFMAGQLTTNIVSEFSPPDQIRQTVTNIKTKLEAVVTGAGKTAWVV